MPEETKTTTIGGIRYDMKLLGGRDAMAVGVIVTGPALRALDELFAGAEVFGKLVEKFSALRAGGQPALDRFDWEDFAGLKDAHLPLVVARAIEALGIDGVQAVSSALTPMTTVYLPSPVPGAVGVFPTPLSNVDDHWKGKFPLFMSWLTWGVWANGFYDVSPLFGKITAIAAAAKELSKSRPASTGSSGA